MPSGSIFCYGLFDLQRYAQLAAEEKPGRRPPRSSREKMAASPPWGNPLIEFPHAKTSHWELFAPLPDPRGDFVKASDSTPEKAAGAAPAKGLSPLETRN